MNNNIVQSISNGLWHRISPRKGFDKKTECRCIVPDTWTRWSVGAPPVGEKLCTTCFDPELQHLRHSHMAHPAKSRLE